MKWSPGYYFGMCKCIPCTFFFQKLERRCSGFDVLKPSLSAKERMYCEEILFIDYMSSEESDYKEQEDPITTQSFGRISDQKTSMGENYAGQCEDKTRSGSQKHLNTTCQTNGKVKACGRSLRKAGTWRSIMGCAVTTDQLFWMRTIYVELCYTWLLVVFLEILLEIKSPLNCCHYIIYISVMCGLWDIKPF